MPKRKPTYDVFVSCDRRDAGTATEIAQIMESYGLKVFTETELKLGRASAEELWDAIAESQAFVAIISESEPSASMVLELGATKAWNKPVYAIASSPSLTRLPVFLHDLVVYPLSRADEIAQKIKRSMKSVTDSETAVLIEEYHRIGMPVDELLLQAKQLSTLTREFVKRTKRQIAAEELVRMLLRLRKQGHLRAGKRIPPHKASK